MNGEDRNQPVITSCSVREDVVQDRRDGSLLKGRERSLSERAIKTRKRPCGLSRQQKGIKVVQETTGHRMLIERLAVGRGRLIPRSITRREKRKAGKKRC